MPLYLHTTMNNNYMKITLKAVLENELRQVRSELENTKSTNYERLQYLFFEIIRIEKSLTDES